MIARKVLAVFLSALLPGTMLALPGESSSAVCPANLALPRIEAFVPVLPADPSAPGEGSERANPFTLPAAREGAAGGDRLPARPAVLQPGTLGGRDSARREWTATTQLVLGSPRTPGAVLDLNPFGGSGTPATALNAAARMEFERPEAASLVPTPPAPQPLPQAGESNRRQAALWGLIIAGAAGAAAFAVALNRSALRDNQKRSATGSFP